MHSPERCWWSFPEVVVMYWEAETSCLHLCCVSILGSKAEEVSA